MISMLYLYMVYFLRLTFLAAEMLKAMFQNIESMFQNIERSVSDTKKVFYYYNKYLLITFNYENSKKTLR